MSCTFYFRPEISFDEIKEFGYHYEYDSEGDYDLIISKKNPSYGFDRDQNIEEFNYLHALMGPNGGFVGWKRYGGNDSLELIEYLTEELGVQLISEHEFELTYFIDAVTDYFKLEEMVGTVEFDEFHCLLYSVVDIDDFIDFAYHDFEALFDWVPRNLTTIEELLIKCGITVCKTDNEVREKNE